MNRYIEALILLGEQAIEIRELESELQNLRQKNVELEKKQETCPETT